MCHPAWIQMFYGRWPYLCYVPLSLLKDERGLEQLIECSGEYLSYRDVVKFFFDKMFCDLQSTEWCLVANSQSSKGVHTLICPPFQKVPISYRGLLKSRVWQSGVWQVREQSLKEPSGPGLCPLIAVWLVVVSSSGGRVAHTGQCCPFILIFPGSQPKLRSQSSIWPPDT